MKDQLLAGFVSDFQSKFDLDNEDDSVVFENFVNHSVLTKYHCDSFDLDQIRVGGTNDGGLDGLSIIVNDHIVNQIEEIEYFRNNSRSLEVQFVFVQSKTSAKFESKEIGNVFFGIDQFFSNAPEMKLNDEVKAKIAIKDFIFDACGLKLRTNPKCYVYYATAGEWVGDETQNAVVNAAKLRLENTNLFDAVAFFPLDAKKLRKIYRELQNQIETQVRFERKTTLPDIDGVSEAYIGTLHCSEFLKLIVDENGELRRRLFYDNVRDFQGRNSVNSEIAETLGDSNKQDKFVLLNNGITIVAKDLKTTADNFNIIDYQIVNGCQTSHIIFSQRDKLTPDTYLPIKLIVTNDPEISNEVIKATNRQTEVKIEAFEALQEFHKDLEAFYTSYQAGENYKIFYERRSKQYQGQPIKPFQIVSIATQLKSFISMFLDEPHSQHRYYGELLKSYDHKVFLPSHKFDPYYASALGLFMLDRAMRRKIIPFYYKRFKYHLLMLFRLLAGGASTPPIGSKKIAGYSSRIIECLSNQKEADRLFREARKIVDACRTSDDRSDDTERLRRKVFTESLLESCSEGYTKKEISEPNDGEQLEGTVKWYNDQRGFGFIEVSEGKDVWFHIKESHVPSWHLKEKTPVSFQVKKTTKGVTASDVSLLPPADK